MATHLAPCIWRPSVGPEVVKQGFGVFEVGKFEALSEPAVDFGQHRASFVALALLREQTGKTGGRAQFERPRALPPGAIDRGAKAALRFGFLVWRLKQQYLAF